MIMKQTLFLYLFVFLSAFGVAQVGINNSNPDDNAVLDLKATDKGLLIPRLTTVQRAGMSSVKFSQGMMVYDTDLDILFVGYGAGVNSTKWYAMNPWKTEYKSNPPGTAVNMTTMTDTKSTHGNVGIGVPSPAEKLDVAGSVKATGLYITGKAGIGVASPSEKLEVAGKTKTSDLYVTGKVGIGTNSPNELLHISSGTSGDAVVRIESDTDNDNENDNPQLQFEQDGGINIAKAGLAGDAGTIFTNSLANAAYFGNKNGPIQLYTNTTAKLTIETGGNVGIGITNPNARLDVAGEVKIGNTSASCTSTTEGSLRYNSTSKQMEFCNGTNWASIKNKESQVYSAPTEGETTTIPIAVIEDLCGDEDGCEVLLMMYNWDGTKRTTNQQYSFFYNRTNKNWRTSQNNAGTNNNGVLTHVIIDNSCYFTDSKYTGRASGADDKDFYLLNWNEYRGETCKIKFFD